MILTPQQVSEVLQIIDRYAFTFIAHHISPSVLSNVDRNALIQSGIDITTITQNSSNVTQAFKFGLLSQTLQDNVVRNMTYEQFKQHLTKGKMFKLNALERAALKNLQFQTYRDVNRLISRVKNDITDTLVHVNKRTHTVKHSKIVTDATKKAIEDRKGINEVISIIGEKTQRWDRDFGRIADFVLHTAFDEGRAMTIVKQKGDSTLVYKDVYAGACPHCIRIFLKGGAGSEPKLFPIDELKSNGTNIGRKVAEYRPVIGPLHPWCRCTLMDTPNGFTIQDYNNGLWLWNGQEFVRDMSKYVRKVSRRSKVNVTVNNETTVI